MVVSRAAQGIMAKSSRATQEWQSLQKKRLILSSDSKPDWGLFERGYHVCVTRECGIVHVFSGGFTPVAQETATTVVCGL